GEVTRGTGFQPVQTAPAEKRSQPSHSKSNPHGLEARATSDDKTTQGESLDHEWPIPADKLRRKLAVPSQGRLYYLRYALKMGWTLDQIYELTKIDRWFLAQMKELVAFENEIAAMDFSDCDLAERSFKTLFRAKQYGYSDV